MRVPIISSLQKNNIVWIALLAILVLITFSPVLKAQFLNWDDDHTLTSNVNVLSFSWPHLKAIFSERVNGAYTPLSSLSLAIENSFFGLNPFIYHLNNLLLHIVIVVLVFFFAKNLGLGIREALLGAFIFALHPTKVESVAWITERKDLGCAVFYMASLINYQKDKTIQSFIFAVLSILSNPVAVSLPLIMLLLDWFYEKTINIKTVVSKWPVFLIVGMFGWQTYSANVRMPDSNVLLNFLIWIWSFIFYIQKFLIPQVSLPIYALPKVFSLFTWTYGLSVVSFIMLLACVWFFRRNKWIVFTFAFYTLSIFCLLRWDDVNETSVVADRYLYISSLGLSLLIARASIWVYDSLKKQEVIIRYLFSIAMTALAFGLILLTYEQTKIWHDTFSLWKHQIKISPNSVACNNLANALRHSKNYNQAERSLTGHGGLKSQELNDSEIIKKVQEVIMLYKQAISLDSRFIPAYYNLADVYHNAGNFDDALIWYRKALDIDDKNKDVLLGLGVLYQRMNKPQEAIATFKKLLETHSEDEEIYIRVIHFYTAAIENDPGNKAYQEQREDVLSQYEQFSKQKKYTASDYFNLGFLYEQVGGYEEAIRYYKKSLEINPTYEKSLFNLANRIQEMGDLKTALGLYQHLIKFHPRYALAYLNMGVIYNSLGDETRARMYYQKTLDVEPSNAGAYFNLGFLSETSGNLKEALNYYEKALEKDPQLSEGYYNMGNVYAALGQDAEAIASYLKTVNIDPRHQNAFVNLSILSFKAKDFAGAIRYLEEAKILGYTPPAEYLKSLEPYRKN